MTITAERTQQVHFVEPLPGFPEEAVYTLSTIDAEGLLFSLRSVTDPQLRFVLTRSATFFSDYQPELGPLEGVLGSDEVEVLVMLTLGEGLADATANLRAPIVIASGTGQAVQLVLEDAGLPMDRHILPV